MTRQIIGLTGRVCSGKDVVASYLSGRGFVVIDYDKMNHAVLNDYSDRIAEAFPGVVTSGIVDREKLALQVFSDESALRKLESITYPVLLERTHDLLAANSSDSFVLNCPLLARIGLDKICSFIIFVDAPYNVRLERFFARNHRDKTAFDMRDSAQGDILPKVPVHMVNNSGDLASLFSQVDSILSSY